ncbi:MAG: ubiquinol-cytochrome c reductase iron-sulfur subunit [Mariprofundaceae bacterium]|nr:ubiquinol-cytochrome c reductase iron-sulfur subunit [Mariprofundaceae bacterium]
MAPATALAENSRGQLRLDTENTPASSLPEFDAKHYYALHPVEWQEEWGAVQGEILTLYPPADTDRASRRRFILGSIAIMGAIAASLVYPIFRYLIHPLTRKLADIWVQLSPGSKLEDDVPVFIPYSVERVEGYLEQTITRGVWLIRPSRKLSKAIAMHKENLLFPELGWANDADAPIAFSTKCPHLGCNVRWVAEENLFICACHNSRFRLDGEVVSGPAPRGLDTLPVRINHGKIEIMDAEFRAGIPDKRRSS